ncbi:putative organic solute transporter subunit alpha/Transmembrane protein [Dioscorea sansibarensis]
MAFSEISGYRGVYANLYTPAIIIGGVFALIATVLSLWLILQHLRSYNNPAEQKWVIGVLLMVPVYAIESVISLSTPKFSLICDILRNCYEAFALYSFGSYLVDCLGELFLQFDRLIYYCNPMRLPVILLSKLYIVLLIKESPDHCYLCHGELFMCGKGKVIELLENEERKNLHEKLIKKKKRRVGHTFFCNPSVLGEDLYTIVKFGIVQYMILKTLCAFLSLILETFGSYGAGEFKWYYGYVLKEALKSPYL